MHALAHPRSAISPLVAIGLALALIVPFLAHQPWWRAAGIAVTLAVGGIAAVDDAETCRIPNRLVMVAAVPVVVVVAVALLLTREATTLATPVTGALAFAGPLLALHLVSPAAVGFGDVKLAAVLGAALGTVDPRAGLVALCVATAATATVGIARRWSTVPMGPGLVGGAVVALVATTPALEAAASWR